MSEREDDAPVLSRVEEGVAIVTLNRPHRQNGWTPAMGRACAAALDAAARDPAVRAIVVTGAGGHFCAGGDAAEVEDVVGGANHAAAAGRLPPWLALAIAKPVIAAIPGVCFGVGMVQALYCDVRLAADDAKFSTAYVRRGLVAERGMSWLLPRLVGAGRAADLLFSARVVRAEEAERIGLVNRVVPAAALLDEAVAYARTIAAQGSPQALRAIKQQLAADLAGGFLDAFDRAETLLSAAVAEPDFAEGVRSWREKRPPAFAGLAPDQAFIDLG